MKFLLILLSAMFFFLSDSNGQKVTYNDLNIFLTKSTDEGAENILQKGFEMRGASQDGDMKYFNFYKEQSSISFDVYDEYNSTPKYIRVCYAKVFKLEFLKLKNQVVSLGKKLSFFYGNWNKIYFTEYYYKDVYFYFSKGICTTTSDGYKHEVFICSSSELDKQAFGF